MGRRSRRDADYFPFFVKEGRTLTVLQQNHGLAGIGFFTNLMRMLAAKPGHYISIKDRSDRLYLFARLGIDEITGLEMLKTTVETGKIHRILIETYEVIYCPDLVDSLSELYSHRTVKPFTIDEIISTLEMGVSTVDNAMASGFPPTSNAKGEESREKKTREQDVTPFPEPDVVPFADPPTNGYRFSETEFLAFYEAFPKHTNKKAARTKYKTVRKSGISQELLIEGAQRFKAFHLAERTEEKWVQAPDVWLNKGRWDDEYQTTKPQYSGTQEEMSERYKESF